MPTSPLMPMAHQVFISHSAKNREVADAICTSLEKAGIRCWVAPRDVRPGRSFPGEITRAIQQSKVMLLVFSSHSNNSEQVLREVQLATDSHLPLIRFRIEDVSMNDDLKYFLSTPHWLDALTPPLSDHIARLEVAIKELLDQSVEVTGKDVKADSLTASAPAIPPPPVPPIAPPPMPKEFETATNVQNKPAGRKSATTWILLAVAAVVVCTGIVGAIALMALGHSSQEQPVALAPTNTAESAASPAASPTRVAKVKQKSASQKTRTDKVRTPAAKSDESDETEGGGSAFERAGASKRTAEPDAAKSKSAFDRAGGGIDSDESESEDSAEPTPDDE